MTTAPALDGQHREPLVDDGAATTGEIWRIAGPVVVARGLVGIRLYNVVRVGRASLPGEVIRLDGAIRMQPK